MTGCEYSDECSATKAEVIALRAQLATLQGEAERRSERTLNFCAEAGPVLGFDGTDWRNVNFDTVLGLVKGVVAREAKAVELLRTARLDLDPPLVVGRIGGDPAAWVVRSVEKGQKGVIAALTVLTAASQVEGETNGQPR